MKTNKILVNTNSKINPYYIVAPSFTEESAGVRVLHYLCHHLNIRGYPSYILNINKCGSKRFKTLRNLITPIISIDQIESHFFNGINPIVVYPDTVNDNPLDLDYYVRYFLHYPGFFTGNQIVSEELIFSYSKKIADSFDKSSVLFMPISKTDVFFENDVIKNRSGSCFYAAKFKFRGGVVDQNIVGDSIEIKRGVGSQTSDEVAQILRQSKYFICFEDSSLITEALLCGCPVVLIKNEFFDGKTIASEELGMYGCIYDFSEESLEKARKEIPLAQQKFFDSIEKFNNSLENFISITQEYSIKNINHKIKISEIKKTSFKKPNKYNLGRSLKLFIKNLTSRNENN